RRFAMLRAYTKRSQMLCVRFQFAVARKDALQREQQALLLLVTRHMLRSAQRNFERARAKFGGTADGAGVNGANNAVFGGEAVDQGVSVPGQNRVRRSERGFEEVLADGVASRHSIEAGAGIIRVQRDDSVEGVTANFRLQQRDL